jgi:hypothetical protein
MRVPGASGNRLDAPARRRPRRPQRLGAGGRARECLAVHPPRDQFGGGGTNPDGNGSGARPITRGDGSTPIATRFARLS